MNRHVSTGALCLLALGLAAPASAQVPLQPKELVQRLREGGYVIFLRHTQTDHTQADMDPENLKNCAAQRNLTNEGRQQAKGIGEAFRRLGIPIGKVLASHYCRTLETARLMGLGPVEVSIDITEPYDLPPIEAQRRVAALRELLASPPEPGKNTVLVSHRPNMQEAAGEEFATMGEGEMAIFDPLSKDGYHLVSRVGPPEVWTEWARTLAP